MNTKLNMNMGAKNKNKSNTKKETYVPLKLTYEKMEKNEKIRKTKKKEGVSPGGRYFFQSVFVGLMPNTADVKYYPIF